MSATIPVRVMVEDTWDQVTLDLPPNTTLAEAKRRALVMTHASGSPVDYLIKYRGAAVLDEGDTLATTGVGSQASLIVLPRRRRPVR